MAASVARDDNQISVLPSSEPLTVSGLDLHRGSITSEALSDVPSEVIIKARIKYGSRLSACKGLLLEYFNITTIHGLRYIFALHRPIYEKIYWLVLTCASFYFAGTFIWATYLKWQDSPVILGFDETLVPVYKIPFPTITICPEIKMERHVFDFANISKQLWQEYEGRVEDSSIYADDMANLAATMHICEADVVAKFASLLSNFKDLNVVQMLVDLSVLKNVTGPMCKWNTRFYDCMRIFDFVATDEGICVQFNGLPPRDIYRDERFVSYVDPDIVDFNNFFENNGTKIYSTSGSWSLESGYFNQGLNSYPQRSVFASMRNGFLAFLQGFKHNFDYDCRSVGHGYKVFLNSPESVPLTSENYILVPHNTEVIVSVLPNYVVSTDNLHEISPITRKCYFNDERYLRYFQAYSHNNCQTECLTNFTISKCGCVKFWMPKPLDIPRCDVTQIACSTAAQEELMVLLQKQTAQQSVDSNAKIMCDCMPACTSLDYNFEISRARFDFQKILVAFRDVHDHPDMVPSRLTVYFKERQFTAIRRTILLNYVIIGIPTLISNCGSILGLFLGISSLSFIELFYFFSLRICGSWRQRRIARNRHLKSEIESKLSK